MLSANLFRDPKFCESKHENASKFRLCLGKQTLRKPKIQIYNFIHHSKNMYLVRLSLLMGHLFVIFLSNIIFIFSKVIATQGPKQNTVVEFWRQVLLYSKENPHIFTFTIKNVIQKKSLFYRRSEELI